MPYVYIYWILYGIAACILVYYFVKLLIKLGQLIKSSQPIQEVVNHLQQYQATLQQNQAYLAKKKAIQASKQKSMLAILIPIYLAVRKKYKADPELKGFQGYRSAFKQVRQQEKYEKELLRKIQKNRV